ncbi:MAG: amidohydrolase family protein [Armatimonadota bacterium]
MPFEIIDANTVFGPWPPVRADMSVERLVAALRNHGVSKALAISTVGVLHNHNDGNAETLRVCSEQSMLIPVATIDPRGYFGPPGAIAKLAQQGFKMLRFFPMLQEWRLDHAAFCDILDELESIGLPVMMQARETGYPTALVKSLDAHTATFILEGVSFENMAEAVSVMRKHKNVMVDTRELRVPGALRFLVDQVGAERAVFGSGCLRSSLASALGYVMDSEITDEAKALILGGNIKRLVGM